jgi:hypothetical protein
MQTDWTGFGYPGATITMEEDPGTVWTVKANAIFTSANGINDWGHAVYATSALHTTESNIRVTVDINNWVDNGAYTTFPIKRLCLYSNYATTRPQAPFSWNYGRLFWTEGNLQAGQGFANNTLISGANAGSWPSIATQGSDANIGISLKYKGATAGTGLVVNNGNGNAVFKADGMTGTVVNNVVIRGSLTANDPDILVEGSDANIGLDVHTKGTGSFDVNTGGGLQFQIANTASAVNYFQATGGPSGTNPILTTQGSDASVSMRFTTKGAGDLNFAPGGIMAVQMPAITSGVNYWQLKPSVTTGAIQAVALGSDTNIAMQHVTKGTGSHLFNSGTGGLHFEIATPVTSVNYLQVKGSVTGVGPSITALGSDANIDINATPKGAGKFVCSGDITAFSDPKLKTNWMGLGEDFLAKLRKVQYGTFDRIDTGQRQAGINAAHMKEALPEVVPDGNILSVNYGAAAMVTALELLHKIDALEKRIRELEAK